MTNPRFSIITVCYNAEKQIADTIDSLLQQSFQNYEYIIKDGGSSDDTMPIIHSRLQGNSKVRIIGGKDEGIFDAMNIAVGMAKGEYLFFLNAGDCFSSSGVLEYVNQYVTDNTKTDIAYGNVVQVENGKRAVRVYGIICSKKIYYLTGDCICHQALFAKRELFEEKKFDLSYHVCGDKEWQLYQIVHGKKYGYMDFVIADITMEGFSRDHIEEFEAETLEVIRKYCPVLVYGHKIVIEMKKSMLVKKLLRTLGKLLFQKSLYKEKGKDEN